MDFTSLAIQLVSGAVGGNAAGAALKKLSLGTVGNSIVGVLGGALGGQILGMLGMGGGAAAGSLDAGSLISSVAGGGAGGAVLLAIIGAIRQMMSKKS